MADSHAPAASAPTGGIISRRSGAAADGVTTHGVGASPRRATDGGGGYAPPLGGSTTGSSTAEPPPVFPAGGGEGHFGSGNAGASPPALHSRREKSLQGSNSDEAESNTATASHRADGDAGGLAKETSDELAPVKTAAAEALEELTDMEKYVNFVPQVAVYPPWYRRYSDLALYTDYPVLQTPSATDVVLIRLREDIAAAMQLLAEIRMGMDGGFGDRSAAQIEKLQPEPDAPLWCFPGTAAAHVEDLLQRLQRKEQALVQQQAVGGEDLLGFDGRQHYRLAEGVEECRKAMLERYIVQDLFAPEQVGVGAINRTAQFIHELNKLPIVHESYLCSEETNRIDMTLLRGATLAAAASKGVREEAVSTVVTINVSFLRFRDHPLFTREHYFVSALLDAYERYRLLEGNLIPGLRSRRYYEQMIRDLGYAEGRATTDEANSFAPLPSRPVLLPGQINDASPPGKKDSKHRHHSKDKNDKHKKKHEDEPAPQASSLPGSRATSEGATSASEPKSIHAAELQRMKTFYQQATSIEKESLTAMMRAWGEVLAAREYAKETKVKIHFAMRRHGDVEEIDIAAALAAAQAGNGDELLQYAPVLSGMDLTPIDPERYTIKVFARTAPSLPLQLINSTEPQGMDSTMTVRYNETVELHAAHDPIEMLLQVHDSKDQVLAVCAVPPCLTHCALVTPFSTGLMFPGIGGSQREQVGVISLSTNWSTNSGLTIENIEHLFLSGEADPLDPRNARYVALLRAYYGDDEVEETEATERPRGPGS